MNCKYGLFHSISYIILNCFDLNIVKTIFDEYRFIGFINLIDLT